MNTSNEISTRARQAYIARCELDACLPALVGQVAAVPAGFDEIAKGAVVDSNLLAFTPGTSSEVRQDVMDGILFATLVANKAASPQSENTAWFAKYSEVLKHLGWAPAEFRYYEADSGAQQLSMDQVVLELLGSALAVGASPAAARASMLAVATRMLDTLKAQDQPLRLFESRSATQQGARFQVGACHESAEGDVNMVIGAINFHASSQMTRVLFVRWASGQARVHGSGYNVRLNRRHYESVRQQVREKLTDQARRGIEEFDI